MTVATTTQAEVRPARLERARSEDIEIEYVSGPLFRAVNHDSESVYTINFEELTCTCPDHEYRGVSCKHMYALVDELIGPEPEVGA